MVFRRLLFLFLLQVYQGEYQMKRNVMLAITSLLSILLFSLHWADEVARTRLERFIAGEE